MAVAVQNESPLGAVRLRRRLTLEEAAARAKLHVEDIRALEENRLYRFPSIERAVAATLVYGTALGISEREARELAGLSVPPLTPGSRLTRYRRFVPVVLIVLLSVAVALLAIRPGPIGEAAGPTPAQGSAQAQVKLPPPWEIRVDVYNGTTAPNAATEIANEIGGPLAYQIGDVANADRSDYVETRVYYATGAEAIASRLAAELGVPITALPGSTDENRLIVIVGTDRAG
jgi:LytR cell envelope-related transcriptional attenuator